MITQLSPTVRLKTTFSWSTQKVSIQVKKRWFWHTVKSRRFEKDIRAYAEPTMKRVAAEMGLITYKDIYAATANRMLAEPRFVKEIGKSVDVPFYNNSKFKPENTTYSTVDESEELEKMISKSHVDTRSGTVGDLEIIGDLGGVEYTAEMIKEIQTKWLAQNDSERHGVAIVSLFDTGMLKTIKASPLDEVMNIGKSE